jgi:hypothetical protein
MGVPVLDMGGLLRSSSGVYLVNLYQRSPYSELESLGLWFTPQDNRYRELRTRTSE